MYLTRHQSPLGLRWAVDGKYLRADFDFCRALGQKSSDLKEHILSFQEANKASGALCPPIEDSQEVWASGVTYLSSRMAREAESQSKDVYQKVYEAERPELFFKALGWRTVGDQQLIRARSDSSWDVPEPELTLILNTHGEIVGYTVGNDVSSRSIEGENPLYLPQAKVYDGSCAIGPGIRICSADTLSNLEIELRIYRDETNLVFSGETNISQMKRTLPELAKFLFQDLSFPQGVFLMTGTGIVPTESFTLQSGDRVSIKIDGLELTNEVA